MFKSKAWRYWQKNIIGCEGQEISNGFRYKVLHFEWLEPQRKWGGRSSPPPPPSMKLINADIFSLNVSFITQSKLACHQYLLLARFVSTFDLRFEPAATYLYLRYSVSITQNKLWQFFTLKTLSRKLKSTLPEFLRSVSTYSLKTFELAILNRVNPIYLQKDCKWFTIYEAASDNEFDYWLLIGKKHYEQCLSLRWRSFIYMYI